MSAASLSADSVSLFESLGALVVDNVFCQRGERILFENLSFKAKPSDVLHIVGPNGSGKSSLLRMLATLNQPQQGSITWHGKSLYGNALYKKNIAYIGHKDGLKSELSAYQNLSFYQRFLSNKNKSLSIDECLHKMGILECAELPTAKLSFGQRRRLAFARLLLNNAAIWILDEPLTGVDQQGQTLIFELCQQHLKKQGMVILSNHSNLSSSCLAPYLKTLDLSEAQVS